MKIVNEHINEKFEEESDPIKDLDIGLPAFWRKEYEKMGGSRTEVEFVKYFPRNFVSSVASHEKIINLLYGTLKYVITEKLTPQRAFVKVSVWSNLQYNNPNHFAIRKMVTDVLEKHFYMKVNPKFNLQEKFEQDSDPIHDMGIGVNERELNAFVRSKFSERAGPEVYDNPWYKLSVCIDWGEVNYVKFLLAKYEFKSRDISIFLADVRRKINNKLYGNSSEANVYKEMEKSLIEYYPKSVNEKFEQDSDPIKDMNIGIVGLWDYTLEDAAAEIWGIMKDSVWRQVLQARSNGRTYSLSPTIVTKDGCEALAFEPNDYTMKELIKEVQKHIDHAIKVGAINLTNVKYHRVNEKFEEDGDPIKDMAIGLEHYRKKFNMYSVPKEFPSMSGDLKELLATAFNMSINQVYFLGYAPENPDHFNSYAASNPQKRVTLIETLKDLTKDAKELYAHKINNKFGNKIEVYETEIGMIAAYHSDVNKGIYYFSDIHAVIGLEEYV